MLSEQTYAEIAGLSQRCLEQISTRDVVDRVTVIRGYVQLLAIRPARKDYEAKLVATLIELSDLAARHRQPELARSLQTLAMTIDLERAS